MKRKIISIAFAVVFALSFAVGISAIRAEKVSAEGVIIADFGAYDGGLKANVSGNVLTVTRNWGTSSSNGAQIKIATSESEITKVNFTISSTGSEAIKVSAVALNTDELGYGKNRFTVTSATDCGENSIDNNYGAKFPSIAGGQSKSVSVTFGSNIVKNGFVYLCFATYDGFPENSSFTISGVSFGGGSSEPVVDSGYAMRGAAARLDANAGIRFTAVLDADKFDADTEYGMIIFRKDLLTANGINVSAFDAKTDYFDEIETKAADVIAKLKGTYYVQAEPVPVFKGDTDEVDHYEINGSISGILYNNLARDFFGVAYAKKGGEYTYAAFENDFARNYIEVIEEDYANYADGSATKDLMNGILVRYEYQKAGVSEDAYNADKNGAFTNVVVTPEDTTIELNEGGTYDISASVTIGGVAVSDPIFTMTTENDKVATVENGRVTAVKAGTTTVTVTYLGAKSADVTINVSEAVVAGDVAILAVTDTNNMETVDFSANDTSVTGKTVNDWEGQPDNSIVIKLDGGKGETKITFTITNNATSETKNTLYMCIWILSGEKRWDGKIAVKGTDAYTVNDNGAALPSIAKGASLTVTVELNSALTQDNAYVKFSPQYKGGNDYKYDSNNQYVISNIYFG